MNDFVDHTSSATLAKKDGWPNVHSNAGATGDVELTMPAAAEGRLFQFQVEAAFYLKLKAAGSDVIKGPEGASAAGGYIQSNVVNSCLTLRGRAGSWTIADFSGSWAIDRAL